MLAKRSERELVGRDAELALLVGFLGLRAGGPSALLVEGEAGIGKTTVISAALDRARPVGVRILAARPVEGEAELPYSALADLFGRMTREEEEEVNALADPQREALEVALTRSAGSFSEHALARGVLELLRACCAAGPLLLVIDDAQWLDRPTTSALSFALRRSGAWPLRVVLGLRVNADGEQAGVPLGLADWADVRRVALGRLSITQTGALLSSRLGRPIPRQQLETLWRDAHGNPMFALELARQGEGRVSGLAKALERRLRTLHPDVLEAVTAAAAARRPTRDMLIRAGIPAAHVARAMNAEILGVKDDGRLVFSHPLLRSSAYALLEPEQQRDVHARLAGATDDPIERGHHVSRSASAPDPAATLALDGAAEQSAMLGDHGGAATFLLRAAELSPGSNGGREVRAAEELEMAGDLAAARALSGRLVSALPTGPLRIRARVLNAYYAVGAGLSYEDLLDVLAQAIQEAGEDDSTKARFYATSAETLLGLGRFAEASVRARQGIKVAERAGDETTALTLAGLLGIAECTLGHGVVDELRRAVDRWNAGQMTTTSYSPRMALGFALLHTTAFSEAQTLFEKEVGVAEAHGLESVEIIARIHLADAQLRSGRWVDGLGNAGLAVEHARQVGDPQVLNGTASVLALGHALIGHHDEARSIATPGLAEAREIDDFWVTLNHSAVLGLIGLAEDEPAAAVDVLRPAWQLMLDLGVGEPSAFGVPHLLGEALAALGCGADAVAVVDYLRSCPAAQEPWCRAMAGRVSALVAVSSAEHARANEEIAAALEAHVELAEPFEHARTLQLAGRIARSARKWGAARESLTEALERFDALGAARWAEKAAVDIARLPGRRPADKEALTVREREIADLVASGLTNKQVATRLFVSVHTVEATLSRVYAKLGVRSRTALAARLRPSTFT